MSAGVKDHRSLNAFRISPVRRRLRQYVGAAVVQRTVEVTAIALGRWRALGAADHALSAA